MNLRTSSHASMSLEGPAILPNADEFALVQHYLPLAGARVLELGCGAADKTRQIAEQTDVAEIVAAEVDPIQHQKNLQAHDLAKVTFEDFGAQGIQAEACSFDIVLMFKSLHHVPIPEMANALAEIHRVLRAGGLAYISEPIFAGCFNNIIRLFHDEQAVRLAAFSALEQAVSAKLFQLAAEHHFQNTLRLRSFSQFKAGILDVTHTDHQVSPECLALVEERFEAQRTEQGYVFDIPNRIDLLRKP